MNTHSFASLRSAPAECPSDYALDLLHAREIGASDRSEIEAHVSRCARCADRMSSRAPGFAAHPELDAEKAFERVMQASPGEASALPSNVRMLKRRARTATIVSLLSVAAVLLFMIRPRDSELPASDDVVRTKGALALRVFRLRDGHVEPTTSGEAFAPGDRLRFEVDLPAAGHVKVIGVEASGALYEAWPLGTGSTARPAGQAQLLDDAVQLDDAAGDEMLYLVYCPAAAPVCSSRGKGAAPACPEGCALSPFRLHKRAP